MVASSDPSLPSKSGDASVFSRSHKRTSPSFPAVAMCEPVVVPGLSVPIDMAGGERIAARTI